MLQKRKSEVGFQKIKFSSFLGISNNFLVQFTNVLSCDQKKSTKRGTEKNKEGNKLKKRQEKQRTEGSRLNREREMPWEDAQGLG